MYTIEYILQKAKDNDLSKQELEIISEAYKFAKKAHDGQLRKNGEPEIVHSLSVAGICADLNVDALTIIAALLHETNSLCNISLDIIETKFGEPVKVIIDNLSKLNRLKLTDKNESASIYLRKVLVGISEDVRVLIIKLADRLHNMRTADALPEDKRKQKVNETMEVLIPIAHRLGINSIKSELEDLCLKYGKPTVYEEILEKLDDTRENLANSLQEMKNSISEIMIEHGIEFEVKARVKSVYSIYKKLSSGKKWSEIYDILAMRLIVPTESDCYLAVGLIHSKYRSIPKRFKDYIAMPKENMYQSLHTGVFGIDGHIFEIQIRTPEMDEIAEHGIASHWSYKERGRPIQAIMEQKLEMFRNIIDSNIEEQSDEIFARNMKEEFLKEQIYVFTPKGDVMELPKGSTPVDFAYRIHSDVGDLTVGAIINDVIVPLDYELNDGDIVKINTNKSAKPSKQWLKFVKTTQAKNKIKSYFSKKDRESYIERGKELLEKEIRKQKLNIGEVLSEENINKILKDLKLNSYDDLLLSIGSLRYTTVYIINLIYEDKKSVQDIMLSRVNKTPILKQNYKNDVIVAGTDNILVTLATCCNPVPGEPIIGYITKGKGVTVHKKDCSNVRNMITRLIEVAWNPNLESTNLFDVRIVVKTNSLVNHILEIVTKASLKGVSINSIKEFNTDISIDYEIILKVKNNNNLNEFIDELKALDFVMEVIR